MGEQLQKLLSSFKQFWEAQEKKRRILYIAILVAILLIGIIITIILNRKDYVVLYEGLETSEAAEIVAEIQNLGYQANLMSGGTVTVLKGTENTLTMEMAQLEYPKSSLTYDLYTKNVGMFTTESEKKEYARMALESRLTAIISSLNGVEKAVVTLSIPEQKTTVITTLKQYPTASVVVNLGRNVILSNDQIKGITYIVKASLTGLTDENISIVDGNGIPQIAGETSYDTIIDLTKKLAFKTQYENSTKNKILELLSPGYSEDNISVAVNIDLNFDKKVSELTDYRPEGDTNAGVLQHGDDTEASGGNVVDGGVAGVEDNADDTYPTGVTGENGAWTESSISNTYLVDAYKEQVEKEGYSVDWMSIAVVIYTDYIPETVKQELVSLVANAGGVNPTVAPDVVTITTLTRFDDLAGEPAITPNFLFGLTFNQLILAGAVLLILLLILFIALAITSRSNRKKREKFEQHLIETTSLEDEEEIPQGFSINIDGSPVEVQSLTDDSIETKEIVIRREIGEFAKNSPDIVAQLLKNWMKEEE